MSPKTAKKRGLQNPNEPVTKQEFYDETKLIREEFQVEINPMKKCLVGLRVDVEELKTDVSELKVDVKALKVDMFDFKTEMRNNHQSLILAMCEQTQKIIDHFDESSEKNQQEHIEMKRRINVCEKKLVIA